MGSRILARDDLVIQREYSNGEMIEPVQSPHGLHPVSPPGHRRGVSESQGLLPNNPNNVFEYSSTRGLRGWKTPEALGGRETALSERQRRSGRISPLWSGVPQNLSRSDKERFGDLVVDGLAISSSLPFFALAGAMLWFDGKNFTAHRYDVLNQCDEIVSHDFEVAERRLMYSRLPPCFRFAFLSLSDGQSSNLLLGNSKKELHWELWSG